MGYGIARSSARNSFRLTVAIRPWFSASSTSGDIREMRAAPRRPSRCWTMSVLGWLKQQLQVRGQGLRTRAVARVQAQAPLCVVNQAGGGVVHGVAGGRLALHLLVIDLEVLGHRGQLLGRS